MQIQTIILAAGHGTRMRSSLPKVLHPLGGRPLLDYVLDVAHQINSQKVVLVVSPSWPDYKTNFSYETAVQHEARGTGHAVSCAIPLLDLQGYVLVLYGDTPLVSSQTLRKMISLAESDASLSVVMAGIKPENSEGYARVILDEHGYVERIIEYKDATQAQRALPLCNAGIMLIRAEKLQCLIDALTPNNAAGEYYLTDVVMTANSHGDRCGLIQGQTEEFMGINTRQELAEAEGILQNKWRHEAEDQGVSFMDSKTVYLSYDTIFGQDVVIHPFVVIGKGVTFSQGVEIFSFCHISETHLGPDSKVGPFARLRDGVLLSEKAEIGNFVEVKQSVFGKSAKAKHLAYLGDTHIGEKTNIGAGTITCNYDGFEKHQTYVGAEVSVGSNCSLVAPLVIGDRAILGAGSVVTEDVESDALVVARSPQVNCSQGASKFREKRRKKE